MTADKAKEILRLFYTGNPNIKTPMNEAVDMAIRAIDITSELIKAHVGVEEVQMALKLLEVFNYKKLQDELKGVENNG